VPGLEAMLAEIKLTICAFCPPQVELLGWRLAVGTWSLLESDPLGKWNPNWFDSLNLGHPIGCNGGESCSLGWGSCDWFIQLFKVFCILLALPAISDNLVHVMCVGGDLMTPCFAYPQRAIYREREKEANN